MNASNILDAWSQIPSVPIWISSPVAKYGVKKDIREFQAKATGDGDMRTFIFDNTFRDFDRTNFALDVGCELRDDTGRYRCVQVIPYMPRKKIYPMLLAQRIV